MNIIYDKKTLNNPIENKVELLHAARNYLSECSHNQSAIRLLIKSFFAFIAIYYNIFERNMPHIKDPS